MPSNNDVVRQALYERVCESYHAVDDFRMKLLGLLPVATGTGVFLLLSGKAELLGDGQDREQASNASEQVSSPGDEWIALLAIGVFGFLFTLGLFAYELFGIKKCHYLIKAGQRLELEMGQAGQFRSRPVALGGFINEPYASAIIYPASMAAWAFLAFSLIHWVAATVIAGVVLIVGYQATRLGAFLIKENEELEEQRAAGERIVTKRGPVTVDAVGAETSLEARPEHTGPWWTLHWRVERLHRLAANARRSVKPPYKS